MIYKSCLLILWLWGASAWGYYNQNPNHFPMGEEEALIGNAGVALTESSGAVFYNPAALTTITGNKISLTGSSYMAFSYSASPLTNVDGTNLNISGGGFATVPTTFVSVFKAGDFTLAFSVLQPEVAPINFDTQWTTPNTKVTVISNQNDSDIWIGFSAAKKWDDKLSVGISAYVIQHSEFYQSTINIDFPSIPNSVDIVSNQKNGSAYVGEILFGAFYKVSPDLNVGARLQTPTIPLSGSTSYYNVTQQVSSGVLTTSENGQGAANYQFQLPFDLTLGGSYELFDHLKILGSVAYQFPDHFSSSTDPNVGEAFSGEGTLRENMGLIYQVTSKFSIDAGGFINPSAIHSLNGLSAGSNKEDFYEVSLGVLFQSGPVRSGLGTFYLFSNGQGLISTQGTTGSISTKVYGALLTTSYIF